jgi:hypothetical protein
MPAAVGTLIRSSTGELLAHVWRTEVGWFAQPTDGRRHLSGPIVGPSDSQRDVLARIRVGIDPTTGKGVRHLPGDAVRGTDGLYRRRDEEEARLSAAAESMRRDDVRSGADLLDALDGLDEETLVNCYGFGRTSTAPLDVALFAYLDARSRS